MLGSLRKMFSSRKGSTMATVSATLLATCFLCAAQSASDSGRKPVEDAMGRPGQAQPGDVMRFAMPRKDLHVMLGSVAIKPGLALGSWTVASRTASGGRGRSQVCFSASLHR